MSLSTLSKPDVPQTSHSGTPHDAFQLWAQTYDDELNPLLNLEQRFLHSLLPSLEGMSILDVGCGTGRWLQALSALKPASLVGVDSSPAMLSRAALKCGGHCKLLLGDAAALPVEDAQFDLVLASFVLSYVYLDAFASELGRVTRAGARLLITDVHPDTAVAYGWKRAVHVGEHRIDLNARNRRVREIISLLEERGFKTTCLVEPSFGVAEKDILEIAGKSEVFIDTKDRPAIYILGLQKQDARSRRPLPHAEPPLGITGARLGLGAEEAIRTDLAISGGRIASIGCTENAPAPGPRNPYSTVDLSGHIVLPGLINSHDHLEFGLFPKLGHGPYQNCVQWADDIHRRDAEAIGRHRKVPKHVRIYWGAIRNLLCGVTTVCHHNPLSPEMEEPDFPVRVLTKFAWAHSMSMDPELSAKFESGRQDVPFIIHLGEGRGPECAKEIFELDRSSHLTERTVIVHGLVLGRKGMSCVNKRGASLVWCPSSNHFLYGFTHTRDSIDSAERVVLGTDSPLTATGDLLDEIRFAHSYVGIEAGELYRQVTRRPAQVFRMQNGEGTLAQGAVADLIAVRDLGKSPAETLSLLSCKDVELVLLGGRVQLASEAMLSRFPAELVADLRPLQIGKTVRWVRAQVGRLFGEAANSLGCNLMLGGRPLHNIMTEWL